jgi:hypothetical protein
MDAVKQQTSSKWIGFIGELAIRADDRILPAGDRLHVVSGEVVICAIANRSAANR